MLKVWIAQITVLVWSAGAAVAQAPAPATAPASAPSTAAGQVPPELLREMEAQFIPPARQISPEEINKRMQKVLDLGNEAKKKYPNASNLNTVRLAMLQASDYLRRAKGDKDSQQAEMNICQEILSSNTDVREKVQADFVCTLVKVRPQPQQPPTADAADQIKSFTQRYANTQAAGAAYAYGTMLAMQGDQNDLRNQYVKLLKNKYLQDPQVRAFLKQIHEYSEAGQPFEATLTRLDGKTLKLPDDLKGKVVVVDFWASWCPPCVASAPHMKQLYDKYKDQGVEFVGVNLDTERGKAEQFIKENSINWIQTFSGKAEDPTAGKYGIVTIPTIYVVGRDGRVISDNAGEQLEEIIQRAIKQAPTVARKPQDATKQAGELPKVK